MEITEFISAYPSMTVPMSCPCGSKFRLPIRPKERFGIPVKFAICLRCGHTYARNVMNDVALEQFYSSSLYRNLYGTLSVQEHVDKLHVPEKTRTPLWKIAEPFLENKVGKVLEWGSSGGWNLIPFRDFGHSVLGLDVSFPYIEAGRKTYNLNLELIKENTLSDLSGTQFDIIILNHVLEHLLDAEGLLKRLVEVSSKDTVFIIGLPTIESTKDYGFNNFFTVAHIHYFSKHSFSSALSRLGLTLIETHRTHGGLTFVAKQSNISSNYSSFYSFMYSCFQITSRYARYSLRRSARQILKATGVYRLIR